MNTAKPEEVDDYLDEVFGPRGVFAARFIGYEERPSQVKLARAIHTAVALRRH